MMTYQTSLNVTLVPRHSSKVLTSMSTRGARGICSYLFHGSKEDEVQGPSYPVQVSSSTTAATRNLLDNAAESRAKGDNTNNYKRVPKSMAAPKPRVMILLGAPGAGKGTQGRLLMARKHNIVHFSTGDYCRAQIEQDTALGREIKKYFARDEFVPDQLIMNVLMEFIRNAAGKVVLIDGAPRTPGQVAMLREYTNVIKVLYLHVSRRESSRRVKARLTDMATGETFTETDEKISQHLERRELDLDDQNTANRITSFEKVIGYILHCYRGKVAVAVAEGTKEDVSDNIDAAWDRINRDEAIFCRCKLRMANQFALPCGHCTQCSVCAVSGAGCPTCGDAVEQYITLGRDVRQLGMMRDGEELEGIRLKGELVAPLKDGKAQVCLIIEVPESETRLGQHIVSVVDVSGSMGSTMAQQEDEHGNLIDLPYDLLGAVKYSLKAQVKCMTSKDYFSLVVFDDQVKTVLEHVQMTEGNIDLAIQAIDEMTHGGSTNLWGGLQNGLQIAKKYGGRVTVALLTDGVPDSGCEGVTQLKKWKEGNQFSYELVTFAYGSQLKEKILFDLAELGNGHYIWIPSSSETGSIFVKFVANACSVCTQTAKLQLQAQHGAEIVGEIKGFSPESYSRLSRGSYLFDIGSLRFGQTYEVVVNMKLPANVFKAKGNGLETTLPYVRAILTVEDAVFTSIDCNNLKPSTDAVGAAARLQMCHQLRKAILEPSSASYHIEEAIAELEKVNDKHPAIPFYLKDLKGEEVEVKSEAKMERAVVGSKKVLEGGKILKGAQPGKWEMWGCHLIPSYLTTHQKKLCTNLYEVGCMPYITAWNEAFTTMGKEFYADFAPPQPVNTTAYVAQQSPVVVLSSGYSGGGCGSCIAGDCMTNALLLGAKVERKIAELRVGDWVEGSSGTYSKIKYILRKQATTPLFDFEGGLRLSERHPFREPGAVEWRRAELEFERTTSSEAVVYNFVMESGHIILVNGIECLCLGHDSEDKAISHPLYGSSQKMDEAVADLRPDENGTFTIVGLRRDAEGRVCGFVQEKGG